MRKLLLPVLLLFAQLLTAAPLVFDKTLQEIETKPDSNVVAAEFTFANTSDTPVTIERYEGTCSCMSVKVKDGKLTYQPGENGVIHADFNMENFSGTVDKVIAIWLKGDAVDQPSIALTARIHIPVLIQIEPKTARWYSNDTPEPQTLDITIHHDKPIHLLSVDTSNPIFQPVIKTLEDGKHYQLVVTPKATDVAGLAIFRIATDCDIEKQRQQTAFAVINNTPRPKDPKAKP